MLYWLSCNDRNNSFSNLRLVNSENKNTYKNMYVIVKSIQ